MRLEQSEHNLLLKSHSRKYHIKLKKRKRKRSENMQSNQPSLRSSVMYDRTCQMLNMFLTGRDEAIIYLG
jgi:hypothetical protein